jgi:hypothetical protein
MAIRGSIRLPKLPRMADFAVWGCAIARALGHSDEEFLAAYMKNTEARNEEALLASPVAATVMALMHGRTEWEGTPSELLVGLEGLAGQEHVSTKATGWPKAAHVLSRRLNDVRTNLAAVGIVVTLHRDGRRRVVTIRKTAIDSVPTVTSVTDASNRSTPASPSGDASANVEEAASSETSPGVAAQGPSDGSDADDASSDPDDPTMWPNELRELYKERVAIMAEDGGVPEVEATRLAAAWIRDSRSRS